MSAEQGLDRAVARARLVLDDQRRERHLLGELGAQGRGQVRHLVVAAGAARGPFPHLAGAEGGLAAVGESLFKQR